MTTLADMIVTRHFELKRLKEKSVTEYERGYKKGVEDATKLVTPGDVMPDTFYSANEIGEFVLPRIRRRLLIKKVTKWVRICYSPNRSAAYYAGPELFDTEQEALVSTLGGTTAHKVEFEATL
jgi:hypothetical protein